ncbi:hypothetical protein LTR78_004849 [Recurvomyces mirabilis]|uniref:Ribokinase n=1 Tax=Recurvomyces mirabilis TaxID=574656 RepID=A0AAE0WP31_9PEZI|nr:hypothetical protein LTR78_004849 [Recurvomyces mirabilis]KAK5158020.1 hypothetical protein LTS14_003943 [Recurvomyces mirabilis]
MTTADIVVVGSLLVEHIFFIDRLPDLGESFPATRYVIGPGGKGANAAIATSRACHNNPDKADTATGEPGVDVKVRMIGAIGDDGEGKYMLKALSDSQVESSGIRVEKEENTGKAFIMVEETDESRDNRLIYTLGANSVISPYDFKTADTLSNAGAPPDLIISQLEVDMKAVERILETAGKANIKVLLNAAPANNILTKLYRNLTHLVVNESEAAILSGFDLADIKSENFEEIAKMFLGYGVENFILTLGKGGAFYANSEGSDLIKAFEVESVDPTGAGDTFVGAYAAEYVRMQKAQEFWDIAKAVKRANAAGALAVTKAGGQTGIPWANEIDDFMAAALVDAPVTAGAEV